MKDLGNHKDEVVGADYQLVIEPSALKLSKDLKKAYKDIGINPDEFNTSTDGANVSDNPPAEIYEYQNFFLLERNDGKVILLDGFRRLLWYNAPNAPVLARKYKQSDLTDQQVLTLMVNLNHFKFFSKSSWQERGFGLLIKAAFDIDITKFRKAFEAYLSSNETKNTYWINKSSGTSQLKTIKDRITNKHFISDMKFIAKLNEEGCMVNHFFGALVFQERLSSDDEFDAEKFIELAKDSDVLVDLMKKFKKIGTDTSAKSQNVVNQIQEIYKNFFIIMSGGEVEKSYAEKVQECKDLRKELNKDKQWTKLTGHKDVYAVERAMMLRLEKEKKKSCLEFKMIVKPIKGDYKNTIPLYYGYNELPVLREFGRSKNWPHNKEMKVGFKDTETGASWTIKHNYGGYNSYGKKYTQAQFDYDQEIQDKYMPGGVHSVSYDIELWVNIPQKVWKELEKERLGR